MLLLLSQSTGQINRAGGGELRRDKVESERESVWEKKTATHKLKTEEGARRSTRKKRFATIINLGHFNIALNSEKCYSFFLSFLPSVLPSSFLRIQPYLK